MVDFVEAFIEAFIRQLPAWTGAAVVALAWFLWRLWLRVHDHIAADERAHERIGERIDRSFAEARAKAEVEALKAEHQCERQTHRVEELEEDVAKVSERVDVLEKRKK